MTTDTVRTSSSFTYTVREIKGGGKTYKDRTVAAPAFAVVIAAEAGMVKERVVDQCKTGIRDLGRGSDETSAVIPRCVLVMAVRAPGGCRKIRVVQGIRAPDVGDVPEQ
jgi:hypothetical protein